jgi:lipoate-protein ligase A
MRALYDARGVLVVRTGGRSIARASASALTRALEGPELEVSVVKESGIVLGYFQRAPEIAETPIARRSSGGAAVRVGAGTVHVALALPTIDALAIDCTPQKILNRYVRPLLKGITKTSILAAYFGRDWVSAGNRPCAYVAFAHDASSQRTVFEAFVGVRTTFAISKRASFMDKEPATLEEIAQKSIDPERVAEAIEHAYGNAWDTGIEKRAIEDDASELAISSEPWLEHVDEPIGTIFADRNSIGGELMASHDAVQRVNDALARTNDDLAAIGAVIDVELKRPEVALEGVRSLVGVRNAVARARKISLE